MELSGMYLIVIILLPVISPIRVLALLTFDLHERGTGLGRCWSFSQ